MFDVLASFARTGPGRVLVRLFFNKMTFAIPVRRLRETHNLLAFRHPQPACRFYILLVPRQAIAALAEFDASDTTFLTDLYRAVQSRVEDFHLPACRLIVNGGEYQDFPQLPFHLISEVGTIQRSNA